MINFTLTITAAPELLAAISSFTSAITSAKVVTIPEMNSNFTPVKGAYEYMVPPDANNQPATQTTTYNLQDLAAQQINQNQILQVEQAAKEQQQVPGQTSQAYNTTVPTTTIAPTYTMEQLAVAATQLVDAGQRQELVNLLNSFGVEALTALPREMYGAFAYRLRAMGARI